MNSYPESTPTGINLAMAGKEEYIVRFIMNEEGSGLEESHQTDGVIIWVQRYSIPSGIGEEGIYVEREIQVHKHRTPFLDN
jgi:hypothetical protein